MSIYVSKIQRSEAAQECRNSLYSGSICLLYTCVGSGDALSDLLQRLGIGDELVRRPLFVGGEHYDPVPRARPQSRYRETAEGTEMEDVISG